jgi:hypothetical protein
MPRSSVHGIAGGGDSDWRLLHRAGRARQVLRALAAYLLLPNAAFAILAQFNYAVRPLINLDYIALGVLSPLLGRGITLVAYSVLVLLDAAATFAPAYHFQLAQIVSSARDLLQLNHTATFTSGWVCHRFGDRSQLARDCSRRSWQGRDSATGQSFIPQIYFFEQLEALRREPFFAGEIFTSYRSALTNDQILLGARRLGVRVVTLTLARFAELRGHVPEDVYIFTHPVDDPFLAADIRQAGAHGIYTSYVSPKTVPEVFMPWTSTCQPPIRFKCDPIIGKQRVTSTAQ